MKQSPQNIPFFASKMCIPLFYWVGWGGSHACHSAHVEIRGQATGVGPFPSATQAVSGKLLHSPLPTGWPSLQPLYMDS